MPGAEKELAAPSGRDRRALLNESLGRRGRRATIKDVAAQVGVSPMTVSRAINGRDGIRPETRAAVMAATTL